MDSQSRGMRYTKFYSRYLKPRGFVLLRDNGGHNRIYRHPTGRIFTICCDEGRMRMSSPRVAIALRDLHNTLRSIEEMQPQGERSNKSA